MKSLSDYIMLDEYVLYEELTEELKVIVKKNKESLLNNESVGFNMFNINYEIYITKTRCKITNECYYLITEIT